MLMSIFGYIIFCSSLMFIQCENSTWRSKDKPGECFVNFHKTDDGLCQECPPGNYGVNCSYECPPGYFGRICVEKCNCSDDDCNIVEGCRPNSFVSPGTRDYEKDVSKLGGKSVWEAVSYVLFGSICTVVVLAGLFYLKFRLHRITSKRDMGNVNLPELRIQQEEPLAGVAYTQRTETVDEENQYDDLRSSRMIEIHTEGIVTEDGLLPLAEECVYESGNGQSNASIYQMENKAEEWTVKRDEDENEYGHLSDNYQYSVLSLRRNVEPAYPSESSDWSKGKTRNHEVDNHGDLYNFISPRHTNNGLKDNDSDS